MYELIRSNYAFRVFFIFPFFDLNIFFNNTWLLIGWNFKELFRMNKEQKTLKDIQKKIGLIRKKIKNHEKEKPSHIKKGIMILDYDFRRNWFNKKMAFGQ